MICVLIDEDNPFKTIRKHVPKAEYNNDYKMYFKMVGILLVTKSVYERVRNLPYWAKLFWIKSCVLF